MAQFDWGNPTKTPLPFDGQPYVDDQKVVWQWDAALQAWMKAPHLELRKVREVPLLSNGVPVGTELLGGAKRTGTIGSEWNNVYQLSFVELWDASSETLLGRRAHMDRTEMAAWMATIIPGGPLYSVPTLMNVYEVFDTRQNITRWNAWNGLFSSFRGRECYSGPRGYGRYYPAQGSNAGYSDMFKTWHLGVDLELELMGYFFGMTPGAGSEPKACWTSGNKRTQSSIPRSSNGIMLNTHVGSGALRRVWDWGSSDWSDDPGGDWEIFSDGGMIHQNPCHVFRTMNAKQLYFREPRNTLRGCGAMVQPGQSEIEGMLAFAIRNVADPNLIAFLIKPLGVTKCAFVPNFDAGTVDHDVMVIGKYPNRSGDNRFASLTAAALVEERGTIDGFRLSNLTSVMSTVKIGSSGSLVRHFSIDSSMIPEYLCFYMRHKTTGIRSPEIEPKIKIERRKSGMPISFMDHR